MVNLCLNSSLGQLLLTSISEEKILVIRCIRVRLSLIILATHKSIRHSPRRGSVDILPADVTYNISSPQPHLSYLKKAKDGLFKYSS